LHTLAVACASAAIGQLVLDEPQRGLAFISGLLHDIGKAALDEVMPKSFDQLVMQACQKQQGLAAVEQEHLGLTHALVGKRLAEKWYLPDSVTQAIWLHHAEPQILPEMPGGRLAMVVALADNIARQCGIGHSGSCDVPDQIETLTQLLGLTSEQIGQITHQLAAQVEEKGKWLNVSGLNRAEEYYDMIHRTAAQLAQDNSKLTEQTQRSLDTAIFAEPLQEFLVSLSSGASPDQVAGQFAVCFQKTFQVGPVMVLLWPQEETIAEIAVADRDGQVETTILPVPESVDFKTNPFVNGFTVAAAAGFFGWCVQRSQYPMASQALAAPLLLDKTPVAVVIWEDQKQLQAEAVQMLCSVGAAAISTSIAFRNQREQAERLVELMSQLRHAGRQLSEAQALSAIAEMAAGAAHELNNPLAVISGRAQLLQQNETDPSKKQILEQMGQRTGEISDIISDLMAFARPRQPQKQLILTKALILEAMEKTAARRKIQAIESETMGIETTAEVFVDKQQMVQVIGYILDNALDSYPGGKGSVGIEGQNTLEGRNVEIRIIDRGCGMDEATLGQATKPFFSARPAGRKRGMGLAHAKRLLVLNGGNLQLVSQPGKGTTVVVTLPRA
jgi:putative nucleotidyltransferase with HDIG domain